MASSDADHNHYPLSPRRHASPQPDPTFSPLSAHYRLDQSAAAGALAASLSPKSSATILPASTYSKSSPTPPRRLSIVTKLNTQGVHSRSGSSVQYGSTAINKPSPDPREFYQPSQLYDDPFAPGTEEPGHINTTSLNGVESTSRYRRNSSFSSLHSGVSTTGGLQARGSGRQRQSSRSSLNPPTKEENIRSVNNGTGTAVNAGSRQHKLKDLVAKFEQPSGGQYLPPSQFGEKATARSGSTSTTKTSVPNSRKASAASSFTYASVDSRSRAPSEEPEHSDTLATTHPQESLSGPARSLTELSQKAATLPRKPLFGEIISHDLDVAYGGYGISSRPRRGSEGSIPSPTSALPEGFSNLNAETTPTSPTSWYTSYRDFQNSTEMSRTQQQSARQHQRLRSDTSNNSARSHNTNGGDGSCYSAMTATLNRTGQAQHVLPPNSGSRIPRSTRRYSQTSDSGNSSPSTRTNSAMGKYNTNVSLPKKGTSSIPKLSPTSAYPPRRTQTIRTNAWSPARRERTPESPSLTANIIPPPPKVSPPLRSSRPRQPVSMASTSASRARAVDRSVSYQGPNSGRPGKSRSQKLPELSNVNLAARREMITSAFNRSVKVKDEHAAERRRLTAERHAARLQQNSVHGPETRKEHNTQVPEVTPSPHLVPRKIDPEHEIFETPAEEFNEDEGGLKLQPEPLKTSGRDLLTNNTEPEDIDSPTLGNLLTETKAAQDSLQRAKDLDEDETPTSTSTEDTEGTTFETDPQVDSREPSQTMLNHVMSMRDRSPNISPSSGHLTTTDESPTEDADKESIQIMLRNTAYFDHGDDKDDTDDGHNHTPPDDESQDRWSGSSWTDSYRDRHSVEVPLESIEEVSPQIPHDTSMVESRGVVDETALGTQRTGRLPRSSLENEALNTLSTMLNQVSDPRTLDRDAFNEIYRQIMAQSSDLAKQGGWDPKRVTQLCVQQLARIRSRPPAPGVLSDETPPIPLPLNIKRSHPEVRRDEGRAQAMAALLEQSTREIETNNRDDTVKLKPSAARRLQPTYRASLNHPDDWAMTSPSIVDWMQFAAQDSPVDDREKKPELPPKDSPDRENTITPRAKTPPLNATGLGLSIQVSPPSQSEPPVIPNVNIDLPPPGHAPPPPPADTKPVPPPPPPAAPTVSPSVYQSQPPSSTFPGITPPQVPHRVTSLTGMRKSHDSTSTVPKSIHTPESKSISETMASVDSSTTKSTDSAEHKRLRKRRHVIKELIDTENLFGRDMKVVDDIYKGTSSSCAVITNDDIKVLFGNSDQIVAFSTNFLDHLKVAAKPIYTIDKTQRFQSKRNSVLTGSSVGTSDLSINSFDTTDIERDRQTTIGKAFLDHLAEMEQVYTVYLKNHDAANRKLITLQKDENVVIWLGECKEYASDLTTAWSLDALLVKPVQRIAKFPLLLTQLLEATPADHPDYVPCQDAQLKITEIVFRINELKRQADLVEQVVGHRKKKDTDGRTGLSKAFGRRTEKLRQHVGLSEMLEDKDYDELKLEFFYNQNQLEVVQNDIEKYLNSLEKAIAQLANVSTAMEGWIYWPGDDRGHNVHARWPEKENKWINYAVVIRQIIKVALPEHLAAIETKVKRPLKTAEDSFRSYANKFFEKRDKRLLDCAKYKNLKARGDKVDKKGQALIDQFDALNNDIKDRIPKFRASTTKLVLMCQDQFTQIQKEWNSMWQIKLGSFVDKLFNEWDEIEKEQKVEEGYVEAEVLCLGACNRSLLEDTPNYVNFRSPSATLNDGDSTKRSVSLRSDGSPIYPVPSRNSGNFPPNVEMPNINGPPFYPDVRSRAGSTVSGAHDGPHSPEISAKSRSMTGTTQASSIVRTSLSQIRTSNEPSPQLPRLSVETPSPSLGISMETMQADRLDSNVATASAAAVPGGPTSPPQPGARRSSLFTSAMPMGDSPRPRSPTPNPRDPSVLFIAASVYEFNIDKSRREAGYPYLTYIAGEIFDVLGEKGELWLARNQDDPNQQVGWIWNKHFAKLASS